MLLDSRGIYGGGGASGGGIATGGPVPCTPQITQCSTATQSWDLWWIPYNALPARTTVDTSSVWQIETGLKFPLMVTDWTGEVYYSRGQSLDYEGGDRNESCSAWSR